jgi:hypothetical protein
MLFEIKILFWVGEAVFMTLVVLDLLHLMPNRYPTQKTEASAKMDPPLPQERD